MAYAAEERFEANGAARFLGYVGLVLVAGVVVLSILDGAPPEVVVGAVLFGAVLWAFNVRPSLLIRHERLILRNPLTTIDMPLQAVEDIAVGYVVVVRVGEEKYSCPAVSRSRRDALRSGNTGGIGELTGANSRAAYPDFVESRIKERSRELRTHEGVKLFTPEHDAYLDDVRVERAWPEIVLLVGSAVAFAVTLVV